MRRIKRLGGRLICSVPYCRRTLPAHRFPRCNEVLCPEHWKSVPAELKEKHRELRGVSLQSRDPADFDAAERVWALCKAAAIEAAAGITT